MKQLSVKQMEDINGGSTLSCISAITGGVLLVAGLSVVPGAGWGLAVWLAGAIFGPTVEGISIATSC